jgi:hypothetical protein
MIFPQKAGGYERKQCCSRAPAFHAFLMRCRQSVGKRLVNRLQGHEITG